MGCNTVVEEDKKNIVTENNHEANNINKTQNNPNTKLSINKKNNSKEKVTIDENFKKETRKGLTILENVKEILPNDISKDNIREMVVNALGDTIVEDESKFIKGVNLTKAHVETIVDALFNIVTQTEENENIEDDRYKDFKDINISIGFYDANEENVRKFMFKGKNPTDEQVKNTLNQLNSGEVDAKILAIELKDG
jgi:hypothetical protein